MRLASLATPVLTALLVAQVGAGCAVEGNLEVAPEDVTKSGDGKFDSSVEAVFVDFEFDGVLRASSTWNTEQIIQDQMLYTIGHLNAERSVGRLDRLALTNVETKAVDGGYEISYHARLPVAWGERNNVPPTYEFALPRDVTYSGLESFTSKYVNTCVEYGAHDVDSGSMWYYYRPGRSSCSLDDADVVKITATVSLSSITTTGKYPEYHKVWEDDVLRVVAIFGKYEDFATDDSDAGISAYNEFTQAAKNRLSSFQLTTTPAEIPYRPGVAMPDITYSATLPDGKRVEVVALLVDNVYTPPASFDERYAALSANADLIAYNGHAGLGANIRALARKGQWVAGQYVMVFMNGCDTYAYVDGALSEAHASVNPDDPNGTKYMDIITNAMPAYFHSDSEATMAFIDGLLSYETPLTYETMFSSVDSSQVVLVSGEHDNVFVPGGVDDGGDTDNDDVDTNWAGVSDQGTLERSQEFRFTTPKLGAGTYWFEIEGTGDADLYVRVGEAPTTALYDCRPYRAGSNEVCEVSLTTPTPVHVMVRGYTTAPSTFTLTGQRQ